MQEKNKLLFCIDSIGLGGSEKSLLRVLSYLIEHYVIKVAAPVNVDKFILDQCKELGIPVIFFQHNGNAVKKAPASLLKSFSFLRQHKEFVFCIWSHHLDSNRWLQFLLAAFKYKFILIERLIPPGKSGFKNSRLTPVLKRFVAHKSICNVVCGYSQKENYESFFEAKNVIVIPNSRNIKEINSLAINYRNKFEPSVSLSGNVICCVGRLTEQKDPLTIIRAIRLLQDEHEISLIMVGGGPMAGVLQKTADEIGVKNFFLIGHDDDPVKWMAISNIFLLNSLAEGLPGVLLEAMASQIPCIATDIMGNNELVINNYSGLLIPTQNAKALASAIRILISNPDLCSTFVNNGFNHVLENYDIAVEKRKWINLFQNIK